jgi:YVTN family beta-propeller protein
MMCVIMLQRLAICTSLLVSVNAAEPVYLALLNGTGALVYLSPSGSVLSEVPVGLQPREMAFSPDKKVLYTAGDTLAVVDVSSRRRIADIPIEYRRSAGIAVHPRTGMVVVTIEALSRMLLIDPDRRRVVRHFDTKGYGPTSVTFGPAGTWAYVSNSQSGSVAAINIASGEMSVISTGDRPGASVLSANGRELYVLNRDSNNIAIIDTSKQQVIANILVGKGPERAALSSDGQTLVYTLRNERRVAFADTKTRRQTDYFLVPSDPIACSITNDGQTILVSTASGVIYIASMSTKKITGEIKTPQGSAPGPVFELPAQ